MADAELEAVAQKILEQEEATDASREAPSPPDSPPKTPEEIKVTESGEIDPTPAVRKDWNLYLSFIYINDIPYIIYIYDIYH